MNQNDGAAAAAGIVVIVFLLIEIALIVLCVVGLWKVFTKAGRPGWAAIIPILNVYFIFKIAGKPGWWLLLLLIPVVNLVIWIITLVDFARNYGKGAGFAVGLLFLPMIFLLILGYGGATYQGARA